MTERLPRPTVLLYGIREEGRRRQITDWLRRAGIRPVEVAPAEYRQPLGSLLTLPGFASLPGAHLGPAFREEMLVMFAFREGMLSDFLRFFRDAGLAPVALKAMITPSNIQWSSLELYEALREEHAQIQAAKEKREKL